MYVLGNNPTPNEDLGIKWTPLTQGTKDRLDINTELKMIPQDEDTAKFFAKEIWPKLPPLASQKTSKTWKNPKLFSKSGQSNNVDVKDEL
jgi:hypothetical protein